MNVLYQCPECGSRLFAAPGGTKLKCAQHTESVMEQMEEYNGPDFLNVDEKGKTKSKDIILPGNGRVTAGGGSVEFNAGDLPADSELPMLRELYEEIAGVPCDRRWSVVTIKEQIKEAAQHANIETVPEKEVKPADVDMTNQSVQEVDTIPEPSTPEDK